MTVAFHTLKAGETKIEFIEELQKVRILERPNRYVAIIEFPDGTTARAHTPVGGRIGGLTLNGLPGLVSGPYEGRATVYTLEAFAVEEETSESFQWIGINQTASNAYIKEFLRNGNLARLAPALASRLNESLLKPEKKLSDARIDFFVEATTDDKACWIEVKTPLIKLHLSIPDSVPMKTDYKNDAVGARMPKQMTALMPRLDDNERVVLLGAFFYENSIKSSEELKLKDNLDLDGLLTTGEDKGLESWQITFKFEPTGVTLRKFEKLL